MPYVRVEWIQLLTATKTYITLSKTISIKQYRTKNFWVCPVSGSPDWIQCKQSCQKKAGSPIWCSICHAIVLCDLWVSSRLTLHSYLHSLILVFIFIVGQSTFNLLDQNNKIISTMSLTWGHWLEDIINSKVSDKIFETRTRITFSYDIEQFITWS